MVKTAMGWIMGLVAAALVPWPSQVQAQAPAPGYPAHTVTLVVPFPAGSTTDSVARRLSEHLRAKTGGTYVVENRVGADGNVAAQSVLRAPADGHTVFLTGNSVHGANANLYRELPFDPINDFDMVGGVMTIPMVLAVRSDFPAGSVSEFVAEAKKRTRPMFYATGNNSTRGASELFKLRYGVAAEHVPYRGSPQVLADLIGGQFDFAFIDVNTVGPALKEGRLKALATTAERRLASMLAVPALAEGQPGFQFGAWVGVVVRGRHAARHRREADRLGG